MTNATPNHGQNFAKALRQIFASRLVPRRRTTADARHIKQFQRAFNKAMQHNSDDSTEAITGR